MPRAVPRARHLTRDDDERRSARRRWLAVVPARDGSSAARPGDQRLAGRAFSSAHLRASL